MIEKINMDFVLKSSLVHTEETSSNVANIYREKILKNNIIHSIPALHGNSLRGLFRNIGATYLLDSIGIELQSIPQEIFHILFSGGALTGSNIGVDITARRNIRLICPFLSIMGSAMGNDMLQGKLIVSSLLPKCKELNNGELSYWDMTSIVKYTRVDDSKLIFGDKFLKIGNKTENPTQMIYDIEVLNAGIELEGSIYFQDFTELERCCFYSILHELNKKPFIGGSSRIGHGEIEPLVIEGIEEKTKLYKKFLNEEKNKIKEFILNYK